MEGYMKRTAVAAGALAAGALLAFTNWNVRAQDKKWYPFSVEEQKPPMLAIHLEITNDFSAVSRRFVARFVDCAVRPHLIQTIRL
jgi:hypothetical protein